MININISLSVGMYCIDKGIGVSESKGQFPYDSDALGFERGQSMQ